MMTMAIAFYNNGMEGTYVLTFTLFLLVYIILVTASSLLCLSSDFILITDSSLLFLFLFYFRYFGLCIE